MITATYSPDDNKLRLYSTFRLDPDVYARVRAAGFIWAPKQDLFVAPAWTPDREDLLLELAGSIDDDDRSLVERAEERAERFGEYHEHRAADADRAHKAVSAITDNIPLGQPILVGHHSERHARKDQERIENGMRRAIKMWDTAQYWKARAAGALHHAKYKERPDVRARRIKGIEADRRRQLASKARAADSVRRLALVDKPEAWKVREDGSLPTREERAYVVAGRLSHGPYCATVRTDGPNATTLHYSAYDVLAPDDKRYKHCPAMTVDEVIAKFAKWQAATDAYCDRWIAHYDNRLAYERAMLAEDGGLITDRTEYPILPAGRVRVGADWFTVIRVNRKEGKICSVTTNRRYVRVIGIEEVKDYEPPTAEAAKAVKQAAKLSPMINRDSPDARRMTSAEYTRMSKDYKGTRVAPATPEHGAYRYRTAFSVGGTFKIVPVFLTDAKVHTLPDPEDSPRPDPIPPPTRDINAETARLTASNEHRAQADAESAPFDALKQSLKAGVRVVSAPQLFPTPADVAARVIELADIQPGDQVLEPSAGMGSLISAMGCRMFVEHLPGYGMHQAPRARDGAIVTVEINAALAERLRAQFPLTRVVTSDFLTTSIDELGGPFDRIVMNPPFENGSDIKHIRHALTLLKPGGRLVAICANGPRQQTAFQSNADAWIDLDAGTFSGTNVRAAIVVLAKGEEEAPEEDRDCGRDVDELSNDEVRQHPNDDCSTRSAGEHVNEVEIP